MSETSLPAEAMEALRSLVRADNTAAAIRHSPERLPERERLAENQKVVEKAAELLTKADSLLIAAEREQKRLEDDSASTTAKIEKERARLYSGTVTSSKELAAMEKEIESLTKRLSTQDDQVLAAMEKTEGIRSQRDNIVQKAGVASRNVEVLSQKIAEAEAEAESKLTPLEKDRAAYLQELGSEVAARYHAVEERKHGVGGAFLVMGSCGACHTELPASERQKVAHGDIVGQCPSCNRLLVSEV